VTAVSNDDRTCGPVHGFVKRRPITIPGSISDVLDMFRSEIGLYREIAPIIGVRVPACYRADLDAAVNSRQRD